MNYRDEFRAGQREYYWTLPRVVMGIAVASVVLGGVVSTISWVSQPGRMVSKTLDADNVIQNYEWFHDVNGNYLAKTAQITQFKQWMASEADPQEKSRLRMEMAAIQQSCRELARRYNANAAKVNRGIFRGQTTPESLNSGGCE